MNLTLHPGGVLPDEHLILLNKKPDRCVARKVVWRDGGAPRTVLCSVDGYLSELDRPSRRRRRRRACAADGPRQHDEGRLAQHLPEADAAAGFAAVRRDRHHHAHGLGDGALERGRQWSFSIASIRGPAMTAARRSAAASAGRNT